MLTETFTYNNATVIVRRADVRARLKEQFVYRHFNIREDMPFEDFTEVQIFVAFLTLAKVEGDLGFTLPALTASAEDIRAAFEAFMSLDAAFYDVLAKALAAVNAAPGAPETIPENVEKKA